MIEIEKTLIKKQPKLKDGIGSKLLIRFLKMLVREDEINDFIKKNKHLRGFSFLDKVLEHFNFTYQVTAKSLNNIPAEGRLIIVANHPIGSLDGLALLKMIRSIRPDVCIVANELLMRIDALESLFLPVDIMSATATYKSQYKSMLSVLESESALIIFPAGEVSRIKPNGVRDGHWKNGFLKLAKRTKSPILPIFVDAKNSPLFYSLSTVYKPLGTAMLIHEMFNKENQELRLHVGKAIPWTETSTSTLSYKKLSKKFRKHLYRLAKKNKKPLFNTVETIAHPARRRSLKKALYQAELLGETIDGKKIFLYDHIDDSPVIHEIGRLRELTFRTVEEGTGTSIDIDNYDNDYRHIILWDDKDLEIVGAYRIAECAKILNKKGINGLYSHTLFEFHDELQDLLENAIELGRSFVQPRYWGKRSLDYLWYGIGAYLRAHPKITHLFGPVSLSEAYPQQSKEMIISFYQQQFGTIIPMASARQPFTISQSIRKTTEVMFSQDYKSSYKQLNSLLKKRGVKVPTLYKQYAEICEDGGCKFLAFNVDPAFSNCIDSLIIIDINKLKLKKYKRYIGGAEEHSHIQEKQVA